MSSQLLERAVFAALSGDHRLLEQILEGSEFKPNSSALWHAAINSTDPKKMVTLLLRHLKPDESVLKYSVKVGSWDVAMAIADELIARDQPATWKSIARKIGDAGGEAGKSRAAIWLSQLLTKHQSQYR